MADAGQIETFTGSDGFGGSGTGAATVPVDSTNAFGAALQKVLGQPNVQASITSGVAGAFGAVENLFGIQTPEQKAAAAAAAAAQAAQQQQTMLLIGGGVLVVVIGIVAVVLVNRKG